jgi:hypothetical protein
LADAPFVGEPWVRIQKSARTLQEFHRTYPDANATRYTTGGLTQPRSPDAFSLRVNSAIDPASGRREPAGWAHNASIEPLGFAVQHLRKDFCERSIPNGLLIEFNRVLLEQEREVVVN